MNSRKFVTAWMKSTTYDDVVRLTGLTRAQVFTKANSLRTRGVNLPKLVKRSADDSVEALNKIIAKYQEK